MFLVLCRNVLSLGISGSNVADTEVTFLNFQIRAVTF